MPRVARRERGIFERPAKSGIWWIRYCDETGRIHREKVGMRSTAIGMYRKRKDEVRRGKFESNEITRKHKNASIKDLAKDYLIHSEGIGRRSLRDIRQRVNFWVNLWGDRPAKSILKADIEQVRLELAGVKIPGRHHKATQQRRAPATVNRYLSTLRAIFYMAIENDKLEKTPFRKIKMAKENNERVRFLSEEEEISLFTILPKEYHPLVIIAINTGLRWSEQSNLKWEDIDFKQEIITVRHSKPGWKRYIPMNSMVIQTLRTLPRKINNPYVFFGQGENRVRSLPHCWEKYLDDAGIQDFHWHDLRHTFASRLVMAGVPIFTVQGLLGHCTIKMTERYSHLQPGHYKDAVEVLMKKLAPKLAPAEKQA